MPTIPSVEDIQRSGVIQGNDGKTYKLGSQEATNYLIESSKKMLSEPTIESVYKDVPKVSTPDSNVDESIERGLSIYGGSAAPIDEDAIRRSTLDRFQKEVDAVNQVYADKLVEAQMEGRNRLGSSRAIAARSGTLGSDFGAAQKDKVLGQNRQIEGSIDAERLARIESIFNKANTAAADEIAAKRKAQQEGLDSYLKFLGAKTERKTAGLNSIAAAFVDQGIDPNEVDPAKLKDLAKSYGITEDEIIANYATTKKAKDAEKKAAELETAKTEAEIASKKRFTVNEGDALYELQDDGSYKYLGKNPKTTTPGSGSKITLAQVGKYGLPVSVAGKSQDEVIGELQGENVPAWFVEKVNNEAQQNLMPDYVAQLWQDYRKGVISKVETDSGDGDIQAILNALGQ